MIEDRFNLGFISACALYGIVVLALLSVVGDIVSSISRMRRPWK